MDSKHDASRAGVRSSAEVIVIGASTGGTEALQRVLAALPADCPGIVVALHMPEKLAARVVQRLAAHCAILIKEAADGDGVERGRVLIAPGNRHTTIERRGTRYVVAVGDGPRVSRHRPSVDVLFRSAARTAGARAVGVILTGLGDDGARGLLDLRNAGAHTIAQDEATCVAFDMPHAAIRRGAAGYILPLERIADALLRAGR